MIQLKEYLCNKQDENVTINENFLLNSVTKRTLNKLDPKDLYTGILNMYDYIVDNDDIKLFLKDFPVKERLFWKNLYNLYTKQVWSIFDVDIEQLEEFKNSGLFPDFNVITSITPQFRRELRSMLKNSRNNNLDIKPSAPSDVMAVPDNVTKHIYIFTINRTTGLRSIFRPLDKKFLIEIFEKIGKYKA